MLHNDPPVPTSGDNSVDEFAPLITAIESTARIRDAAARTVADTAVTIELFSRDAIAAGCDPLRVRQAAGVL